MNREDRVSGYYESDSYDNESQDNSGGGLRKMLEEVLAENKRLSGLIEGNSREQAVTDLLKDKGLDPAMASIIPKDADAKEWLETNGRFFATSAPAAEQEQTQPVITEVHQDDPAVDAERQAREQMLAAQEAGTPAVTQDELARVTAMSAEDILAEIRGLKETTG